MVPGRINHFLRGSEKVQKAALLSGACGKTGEADVSGIKKDYSTEEMVGKKVIVLVNLKPAELAGVVSEGMLLCAED